MKSVENIFNTAYDDYSNAMFRHCYFRVNDREVALNLTQDAFMRTWDQLHKGKVIKNYKAFLFTTLNNLIIDWYRKKKTERLEDEDAAKILDEHHSKDALLETECKWALSLLKMLDEKTKTAITLRYVEQWSPKEIAKFTGDSVNTISVRINRGISTLQTLVKEQDYE